MRIRKEETSDHGAVFHVVEKAFENEIYTDHQEQFLVERLRESAAFVPELALVAESGGEVVGYILLTKIRIVNEHGSTTSLALAPVAVLPAHQRKGVGELLIKSAHEKAKALGFGSVVLLGHENYYPRFGYQLAGNYDIKLPFDVPAENCMAIELVEGTLNDVNGMVEYPPEFNG
ncbi:GNAT family N-acetyltransferase [Parapedobacter sp. 10938]|uniref:GNAT family N-acetyltransferase n=1 Tax=Parapedobacter flavus TaxID=3110225 RepID=UPI002DB672EC|nr:N-acetyltransferase [Parapedobacter sp. 10938]MEC3880920.1 N-acetyltransferase [Parapedobacter sp. 10938]